MKRIITINREFGSGGYMIGQQLAERMGWDFYDKRLVLRVAEETGYDPAFIRGEERRGDYEDGFGRLFSGLGLHTVDNLTPGETLWNAQQEVILKLAEQAKEKPFVIIGRCADFILRDNDDALNVFIYASREKRLERLGKYPIYGQIENPEQAMKKKDKRRASNYRQRTGQEWGLIENYHVALDSGVLGLVRCVDVLELLASRERA